MAERVNEVTTPGGAIGGRIARLVADAIVHTRAETAPTLARLGAQIFTDTTNHVSDEIRSVMGPIFRAIAEHPDAAPETRALFANLGTARGQAWAWVGGTATGAALGGGLMNLLTNELNPAILPLIAANPHGILSPSDAAQAHARGIIDADFSYDDAAKGGMNRDRWEALVGMARARLAPTEIVELLRRGTINGSRAQELLRKAGWDPEQDGLLMGLTKVPLSPADAAAGQARNLLEPDEVRLRARQAGLTDSDADVLMGLAGEPPSAEQLIYAWRRGVITERDVDRGIVQGPVRNEWIPVVKALADQPLPPQEAASAVTQGHLSYGEGESKARLSGILPEDFKTIVANAGRPPGIEFAAEAFNRQLIGEAQWERMFLESAIKNEYIPLMRAMRTNLIPAETARMMYRLGVYPRDALVKNLTGHGFTETDAQAQAALEDVRKTEGTKDLSAAQVLDLYRDELITEAQADGMLRAAGYDEQEAQWRIAMAEVDKMRRFVNAAVTKVRSAYVNSRMDANEAIVLLDQIGIHPTQRDRLIDLWDLERDVVSSQLTTAQVQAAQRKGFISEAEAYDKHLARGYSPVDADILVRLAGGSPVTTQGE